METAKLDRPLATIAPAILIIWKSDITLRHAAAVDRLSTLLPLNGSHPDLIGFHGQTVLHRPQAGVTVQLGDGRLLARKTGIPVIYDMRANDMAHGGQGAPLVPAYHAALARSLPEPFAGRCPTVFVNVGGISNITYVPRTGDPVAFDTGPGNALIDQWVSCEGGVPFDSGGAIASEGGIVTEWSSTTSTTRFSGSPDRSRWIATISLWRWLKGLSLQMARARWPRCQPKQS